VREPSDHEFVQFGRKTPPLSYALKLPRNETNEAGDRNVTFFVSLASEPTANVTAFVAPVLLNPHPHGGAARHEGAPLGDGSSYEVVRRHKDGMPDYLARGGEMSFTFGLGDWKVHYSIDRR
jgi:hypothetical protein